MSVLPVVVGVAGDALAIQQVGVLARAGRQGATGGRRSRVSGWRRTRQGAVGRCVTVWHEPGFDILVALGLVVVSGVACDALAVLDVRVLAGSGRLATLSSRGAVGALLQSRVALGWRRAAEVERDDALGEMERGDAGGDGAKNEAYDRKDDAAR